MIKSNITDCSASIIVANVFVPRPVFTFITTVPVVIVSNTVDTLTTTVICASCTITTSDLTTIVSSVSNNVRLFKIEQNWLTCY